MRPPAAVKALLAGLLTGGIIASGATPAPARPHPVNGPAQRVATTLTARLAPPAVTVGEPASLVARLSPSATRPLTVQRFSDDTWSTLADLTSDSAGRAVVPLDTSVVGNQVLRVVAVARGRQARRVSATVTLRVTAPTACTPRIALVDRAATAAATCLAARLDRWKSAGLMGVGQQLNVSNRDYLAPLTALGGRRVSVLGFDLEELAAGEQYEFPDPPLDTLAALAQDGTVLSASWHPSNPHTGGSYADRGWTALGSLLDESTPEYQRFWSDFDAKIALFQRFQDAGVAVVFRPFHEANGGWFWWGQPDPSTYKRLWKAMQDRAWAEGIHNIVWGYSFAARTGSWVHDPVKLLPARVDLAGIDSYDPEAGSGNAADRLPLGGWADVAKKVERMTMTEVGPQGSPDGAWDPVVIPRAAKPLKSAPLWAMLWFDDGEGTKQISSLGNGLSWLDTCPNGYCYLR